jgi:serine protease SohB
MLNFHDLAKRYGIMPITLKAGMNKNPVSQFGAVSRQDLDHERQRLEKVHDAFKDYVVRGRPDLQDQLDSVADGSIFLGSEALDMKLADRLMTSSEYILEKIEAGDRVLKLHRSNLSRFPRRIISPIEILPHLKAWAAQLKSFLVGGDTLHQAEDALLLSRLVHAGSWLGFVRYLIQQYIR